MDDVIWAVPEAELTTTGRTSGLPRTIEIWFAVRKGTAYLLAGDGEHAHWVRNIVVNPLVRLRVGGLDFAGRGRIVSDLAEAERARDALVAKYQPGYPEDLSGWRTSALPIAIDLHAEPQLNPG